MGAVLQSCSTSHKPLSQVNVICQGKKTGGTSLFKGPVCDFVSYTVLVLLCVGYSTPTLSSSHEKHVIPHIQ